MAALRATASSPCRPASSSTSCSQPRASSASVRDSRRCSKLSLPGSRPSHRVLGRPEPGYRALGLPLAQPLARGGLHLQASQHPPGVGQIGPDGQIRVHLAEARGQVGHRPFCSSSAARDRRDGVRQPPGFRRAPLGAPSGKSPVPRRARTGSRPLGPCGFDHGNRRPDPIAGGKWLARGDQIQQPQSRLGRAQGFGRADVHALVDLLAVRGQQTARPQMGQGFRQLGLRRSRWAQR